MLAQVLGEVVDARGEERHLHFGRSGIRIGLAELRDDVAFGFLGQAHRRKTVAEQISRARCTSSSIWATRSSTDSNRFSPRSRSTNATRSCSPYRSPSKSSR